MIVVLISTRINFQCWVCLLCTGFAEQVEALYPYTAMNEDELTFEAGAIISVIDKEDAAWWKGTLEGAVGVFPSNYVQPYPSDSANTAGTPDAEDSLCCE